MKHEGACGFAGRIIHAVCLADRAEGSNRWLALKRPLGCKLHEDGKHSAGHSNEEIFLGRILFGAIGHFSAPFITSSRDQPPQNPKYRPVGGESYRCAVKDALNRINRVSRPQYQSGHSPNKPDRGSY
jgi:hypothetical protein